MTWSRRNSIHWLIVTRHKEFWRVGTHAVVDGLDAHATHSTYARFYSMKYGVLNLTSVSHACLPFLAIILVEVDLFRFSQNRICRRSCVKRCMEDWECARGDRIGRLHRDLVQMMSTKSLVWKMISFIEYLVSSSRVQRWRHLRIHSWIAIRWVHSRKGMVAFF